MSSLFRPTRGKLPWVFTEHGVAMLSSVLRLPTAVRVNIEIVRTLARLRHLMATPGELVEQLTRQEGELGILAVMADDELPEAGKICTPDTRSQPFQVHSFAANRSD